MADSNTVEVKQKSGLDLKIIIIGLVLFIVTVGGSFMLMRGMITSIIQPDPPQQEEPAEIGELVSIGEFMTNVNDVNGTRFLKVDVTVESSAENSKEKIDEYMPVIRDSIQTILSAKTVADLDIRNRDHLKDEIIEDINAKIGGEMIQNVYFTSFIMQ